MSDCCYFLYQGRTANGNCCWVSDMMMLEYQRKRYVIFTVSVTVKPVLKAVILFAEFFKNFFPGNNTNFSSFLNILLEFNFTCSNTLELNCTDSLIQMCAKFSRVSGIYLLYFLQNGSVTIAQS